MEAHLVTGWTCNLGSSYLCLFISVFKVLLKVSLIPSINQLQSEVYVQSSLTYMSWQYCFIFSTTSFDMGFKPLSCWNTQQCPSFNHLADRLRSC